jgi:Mn-dependent DtxR family transcriptional regulator
LTKHTSSQIAAELGCAPSTVNNEYQALAARGLARRAGRGRWVATNSAADIRPAYDDALAYVREHPGATVSATAKAMSVTRYTARHDLQELESQGLVTHNADGTWSATAEGSQHDE